MLPPSDRRVDDTTNNDDHKELHIAPMLHVSTTEFRAFLRILTKRAVIWTEMVVDETLQHAPRGKDGMVAESILSHIYAHEKEHPMIAQIGASRCDWLRTSMQLVQAAGYTYGIDLNLDCPSSRVQSRKFGAMLMQDADTVCQLVQTMRECAMHENVRISIKCRIGVDDCTSYEWLCDFIRQMSTTCQRFMLHGRCVWLKGLSPAQNRLVPPLHYGTIYRICQAFPDCDFWINGGISTLGDARKLVHGVEETHVAPETLNTPCPHCNLPYGSCKAAPLYPAPTNLRGCLLGRVAMDNPAIFADVDRFWYGEPSNPCANRRDVLDRYCNVLEEMYPSRCCDGDNDNWTAVYPAPQNIERYAMHCPICCTDPSISFADDVIRERSQQPIKIKQGVVDRCVKPIMNLFFGIPGGARDFRRAVDTRRMDTRIRNCGPSYILQQAVQDVIPDALLDQPFVPTAV